MSWLPVCQLDRLTPDRGAAALVDGTVVALFRLATGEVHALDGCDPFSKANVLARGLVGSAGAEAYVASPMFKQRFAFSDGRCLDDPGVAVNVWPVRVVDGVVEIFRRVA